MDASGFRIAATRSKTSAHVGSNIPNSHSDVRRALVHHRAAPIALDVGLKPLMWTAPAHAADLSAWQNPLRVAVELVPEFRHHADRHEVNKGIAQASFRLEIDRQVEK